MKRLIGIVAAIVVVVVGGMVAMAIEEAKYDVVKKERKFEIRDYAPYVLAETTVEGSFEDAGNKAFSRLFKYISGENQSRTKISMTAPVSQEPPKEKIKMTAPVSQQRSGEKWVVSFMMPASYKLDTLPKPKSSKIALRQVPAQRMVAVRYSGNWDKKAYLKNKAELEAWIKKNNLVITGEPIWARYNSPLSLSFFRRNEILVPIKNKAEETPEREKKNSTN